MRTGALVNGDRRPVPGVRDHVQTQPRMNRPIDQLSDSMVLIARQDELVRSVCAGTMAVGLNPPSTGRDAVFAACAIPRPMRASVPAAAQRGDVGWQPFAWPYLVTTEVVMVRAKLSSSGGNGPT
jgi:hypothetical protein